MRFYTGQHQHYCGVDLHTRTMYLCILDANGEVLLHRNVRANPDAFLKAVEPYREGLVVAVECIFTWYWLADLCGREGFHFVLGHALYMKAVHGGKSKNDRIDAHRISALLRGGNMPMAYVYPPEMRATRDLLRRRTHLVRKRGELAGHVQILADQCNLPRPGSLRTKHHRPAARDLFSDPLVRRNVELVLDLMEAYDPLIDNLEKELESTAKCHDAYAFQLLRTIPGVGAILGMTFLYEIHDINRFPTVQTFCSYARLIGGTHESAGKPAGSGGKKIGNVHLKWAFGEAASLMIANHPPAKEFRDRLARKHGKGKAMAILAHRLGRIVYYILKRRRPFDPSRFAAAA